MDFQLAEQAVQPGVTDVHFALARATGFAGFGEPVDSYLVALEAQAKNVARAASYEQFFEGLFATSDLFRVHPAWRGAKFAYATATVDAKGLSDLQRAVVDGRLTRFEVALAPRDSRSPFAQDYPKPEPVESAGFFHVPAVAEAGVMYGVVDVGCPFAHAGARTRTGATRILNFWDQGAAMQIPGRASPAAWEFGTAVRNTELDAYLSSDGCQDEGLFYERVGLRELGRRASHGAHILGNLFASHLSPSLAWEGKRDRAARTGAARFPAHADTVFVQLPSPYVQGMPRCALAAYRLAGLRYILACAGDATKRIVVPLSSENYDGPHDGTSLFESALDALIVHAAGLGKDMRVVISAGNGSRAQTNAEMKVTKKGPPPPPLRVRVLPGNERATFVELWIPAPLEPVNVSLQPPGAAGPMACAANTCLTVQAAGDPVVTAVNMKHGRQRCILLRIAPTLVAKGQGAPVGDWQVGIEAPPGKAGRVFAFIARSTHGLGGHRRSYQSYFVQPYSSSWNFTSDVLSLGGRPFEAHSLNGLANGKKPWVAGGYRLSDGKPSKYSARGPSRSGGRFKGAGVDLAAPSEESVTLSGIRSWGNTSAASVRLGGTSVAAPLAARFARRPEPPARAAANAAEDRRLSRADVS